MKNITVLTLACIFLVASCGCLNGDKSTIVKMSMNELIEDDFQYVDNATKKLISGFNSLDDGDILVVQDTIMNISFEESYNLTVVELGPGSQAFSIEGDVTDKFKRGDAVELKLHIVKVVFLQQNQFYSEIWTFDIEIFEEGWDFSFNTAKPIPAKYIKHR
jgi:hypothetical protein